MARKQFLDPLDGLDFGEVKETAVQKVKTSTQVEVFDYSLVDESTARKLQNAATQIANNYADNGRILAEMQKELAGNNQYNGYFEKWYRSLGMTKATVYTYISIYNYRQRMFCSFATANEQTEEMLQIFDSLPQKLQVDISSKNAPDVLVEQVFAGDITTHKEYVALKKQLEEKEKALEEEQNRVKGYEKRQGQLEEELAKLNDMTDEATKRMAEAEFAVDDEVKKRLAAEERVEEAETRLAAIKDEAEERVRQLQEQIEQGGDETKVRQLEEQLDKFKKLSEESVKQVSFFKKRYEDKKDSFNRVFEENKALTDELNALKNAEPETVAVTDETQIKALEAEIERLNKIISSGEKGEVADVQTKEYEAKIKDLEMQLRDTIESYDNVEYIPVPKNIKSKYFEGKKSREIAELVGKALEMLFRAV